MEEHLRVSETLNSPCLWRQYLRPLRCARSRITSTAVAEETIIREFRKDDLDAIVELSLRAWEPVFASLRKVLGDGIFLRLHPDWKEDQADEVRSACADEERDVFVAVTDRRPVGFVAIALNFFHEGMGAIDIIGVDPDHQLATDRVRD